ncbi:MAG: hypothetical protein GF409_05430 [Candidatus Omnitrophica bacterium]|nr:hypothetical protein [Candidatus Omnitrophota bacterium]
MRELSKNKSVRSIAFVLCILLVWQGVVWANPDITRKSDLQPQTFFDPSKQGESYFMVMTRYVIDALIAFEADPANRNLFSIKDCAQLALDQVKNTKNIPAGFLQRWPLVTGSEASGEVSIGIGPYRIRYFNPKIPGSSDPGSSCQVQSQEKVGEYLMRQLVLEPPDERGFVTRVENKNEAHRIHEALVENVNPPADLRHRLIKRVKGIEKKLDKRIQKAQIDAWTRKKLQQVVELSASSKFLEFSAVVLTDRQEPTRPHNWLLGFNTTSGSGVELTGFTAHTGPIDTLFSKLKDDYPDTIGLCTQVLDLIEMDEPLLQEYIFHEMICPYFGHERARAIQVKLFPENYEAIEGDRIAGHRDGELSIVLKNVLWDRCDPFPDQARSSTEIGEQLEKFKQQDFLKKTGPQDASHFFTLYKQYFEWIKRQYMLKQSRLFPGSRKMAMKTLRALAEEYRYIFARLSWIWEMEVAWEKGTKILGQKGMDDKLTPDEMEKLREVIQQLLAKHESFMKKNSASDLLKEDEGIRAVISKLRAILGTEESPAEEKPSSESAKAPEKEKAPEEDSPEKKEASLRIRLSFWDRVRAINWKSVLITFTSALLLSGILYMVMPVNIITVGIAIVVPVTLFAALLIKNWTGWKNFLLVAGLTVIISVGLSMFLPIPWFGLSLAVVVMVRLIANRKKMSSRARAAEEVKKPDEPEKEKKPEEKDMDDPKKREEAIKAMKYAYRAVHISFDLLQYIMRMIKLMFGVRQKDAGKETGSSGEKDKKKKDRILAAEPPLDTRNVLDAVFRLDSRNYTGDISKIKEELRPIVFSILRELEWGFSLNFEIQRLKNWVSEDYEELARALQEIAQEVSQRIASRSTGEESRKEMLAINQLIAEFCQIAPGSFLKVRQYLTLLIVRDDVKSKQMNGSDVAADHYTLARAEFFWHFHDAALEAFQQAVNMLPEGDPRVKEYYLSYGIAEHYVKNFDSALEKYKTSLKLREQDMKARKPIEEILPREMVGVGELTNTDRRRFKEINSLRYKLTQELIFKATQRRTLKGDIFNPEGEKGAGNAPSAVYLIKRIVDPDSSFWQYAIGAGPRTEEKIFTLIPFAVLSSLVSASVIGIGTLIIGMAAVYSLFVAMHTPNIFRAHKGSSLWERIRYAFKAPVYVTGFNLMIVSMLGGGLAHSAHAQWPTGALIFTTVLFNIISYAMALLRHENVNNDAVAAGPISSDEKPGTFNSAAPATVRLLKRIVDPDLAMWEYSLEVGPRVEERIFTLLPFAVLSSLVSASVIGIFTLIAGMSGMYALFVALHTPNLFRAPKGKTLWGRLKYAYKAPVYVAGFNLMIVSMLGGGLAHSAHVQWPAGALVVTTVLFNIISYAMARLRHENINQDVYGDTPTVDNPDYAPASLADAGKDRSPQDDPGKTRHIPIKFEVSESEDIPVKKFEDLSIRSARNAARLKEKLANGEGADILFTCVLNAQRSFLMEVIAKDIISRNPVFSNVNALSCGLRVADPSSGKPHRQLVTACIRKGMAPGFVEDFLTRQITAGTAEGSEFIVAPSGFIAETLEKEFPEHAGKIVFLSDISPSLAEGLKKHIPDPSDKYPRYVPDYEHIKDALAPGEYIDTLHEALSRDLFGIEEGISSGTGSVPDLEKLIPSFVNALIAAISKKERVVLALDLDLGSGEINDCLRDLAKFLPTIVDNNEDLERFFKNLEIIKGEGRNLARRVSNITDPSKGAVDPDNLIVITSNKNTAYYSSFQGRSVIAGIDDSEFPEAAYLPLLDIMLFAIGKYLQWDPETLKRNYRMIPNVVSSRDLSAEECRMLFGSDRMVVIKLVPDAEELDKERLRDLMDSIKTMLARA